VARGEIVWRLRAAVQHHDERQRLPDVATWNVELVMPTSRGVSEDALLEPGAVWDRRWSADDCGLEQVFDPAQGACLSDSIEQSAQPSVRVPLAHPPESLSVLPARLRSRPGAARRLWRHHIENGAAHLSLLACGIGGAERRPAQEGQCFFQPALPCEVRCFQDIFWEGIHWGVSCVGRKPTKPESAFPCRRVALPIFSGSAVLSAFSGCDHAVQVSPRD
jgi:hypothetical protein